MTVTFSVKWSLKGLNVGGRWMRIKSITLIITQQVSTTAMYNIDRCKEEGLNNKKGKPGSKYTGKDGS